MSKGLDYARLEREAELSRRIEALSGDVLAYAEGVAEHTAERFEPAESGYYLDQFLTVAGNDFRQRMPWSAYTFAALVIPQWCERFAVLSRTLLAVIKAPGPELTAFGETFNAVGLCKLGSRPSLLNPPYDYVAVYPCRAPGEGAWLGAPRHPRQLLCVSE